MYFSRCTVSFIPLEVSDTKLIFAFFTLLFVKMLRHQILLNMLASVFLCAFLLLSIRKSCFCNNMSVRLGNMAYKKYLNNCRISRHTSILWTSKVEQARYIEVIRPTPHVSPQLFHSGLCRLTTEADLMCHAITLPWSVPAEPNSLHSVSTASVSHRIRSCLCW